MWGEGLETGRQRVPADETEPRLKCPVTRGCRLRLRGIRSWEGRPCCGDPLPALFAFAAAAAEEPVVSAIGAVFAGQIPVRVVPVIQTGLAIREAINPVAEPLGEMAAACRQQQEQQAGQIRNACHGLNLIGRAAGLLFRL